MLRMKWLQRKIYLLIGTLVLIFSPDFTKAQAYAIGSTTITFNDASRSRPIETKIFYPSDIGGVDEVVASGQFPVLVLGHGFLMGWDSYQIYWEELVPEGHIVCLPTTESGPLPSHGDFGQDISFIIAAMQEEGLNANSLFYNAVSSQAVVMGHSMGGGSSVLSASASPLVTAMVNFAAAETNPSAISAASSITVPSVIFSGDDDCVTPEAQNQDLMYDNLASSCKYQISIINGAHCLFANSNAVCSLGETFCNPSLSIMREEQLDIVFSFLKPWLKATLLNDAIAQAEFSDSLQTSTRVNVKQLCMATNLERDFSQEEWRADYHRSEGRLSVICSDEMLEGEIEVYTLTGSRVHKTEIRASHSSYDISSWSEGVYVILVTGVKNSKVSQLIIR